MNARLVTLATVVVALGAGVGVYVLAVRGDRTPPPSAAAPAAAPASDAPKALVATVPEFTLVDREGKTRSLQDWNGKSLVVNFWATWCAPCRKEIPLLERLQHERAAAGFQVVGIAVDFRDKVLAFADEMKIDYPLLIGEQEALDAAAAFGIDAVGFPFTVFSDARGRVVAAHMGELTEPMANLILDAVARVNAGTQSLEQARAAIESGLATLPRPQAKGS